MRADAVGRKIRAEEKAHWDLVRSYDEDHGNNPISPSDFTRREATLIFWWSHEREPVPRKWLTSPRNKVQRACVEGWRQWFVIRGLHVPRSRPRLSAAIKAAVIERDGLVCQICFDGVSLIDVHLDHIVPYALGGPTTVDNLRVTHSRCNLQRPRPRMVL